MSHSPVPSRHSLNDGVMLRASSQQPLHGAAYRQTVTVTNYPEHLNPFYKDENHKRIRFLKVIPKKLHLTSSSSSKQPKEPKDPNARRSSFSVNGIKDMWRLRPFRSGNKTPMPTHVTKTSESPPQIRAATARKQDQETFQDVPFQRSHRVRASMSEVSSSGNGFGGYSTGTVGRGGEDSFARNSRYRSTLGGAVPVAPNSPVYSLRPGTSQLSVRSTNPFEDDMEDDVMSVSGYSVASMPNRPYRKKRRAPLPPTSPTATAAASNKTDDDKASTNPRVMLTSPSTDSGTVNQVELINEKTTVEIQNIASEIDAMIRRTESPDSIPDKQLIAREEKEKQDEVVKELEERFKSESKKCDDEPDQSSRLTNGDLHKDYEVEEKDVVKDEQIKVTSSETIEVVTIEEDHYTPPPPSSSPPPSPPTSAPPTSSGFLRIVESEDEDEKMSITIQSQETPPTTVIVETKTVEKFHVTPCTSDPYKNVVSEMEKYDVRYVPLKESEHDEGASKVNGNKTVKDIIESINKSQSLLKINVEDQKRRASNGSNGSINTKIRELERKESECLEMLNEIDLEKKFEGLRDLSPVEEFPLVIQELNNNNDEVISLFTKCKPSPSSPSATSHDWNPLPKPKRSHSASPN